MNLLPFYKEIHALLKDSPTNDDFDVITYEFVLEQGSIDPLQTYGTDESNSYIKVSTVQNIESQDIYWSKSTLFAALSNIGGSAVTYIALASFFISHYQTFAYDREALNQLFYETKNDPSEDDSDDDNKSLDKEVDRKNSASYLLSWQNELKHRFKDRQPIYYGYMAQLAVVFLSKCCCCCVKKYENDDTSWFARRKKSL